MLDFRMDQRSRLLKEKFYQWKHGYVIALWRTRAVRLAMELQLLKEIRQKNIRWAKLVDESHALSLTTTLHISRNSSLSILTYIE